MIIESARFWLYIYFVWCLNVENLPSCKIDITATRGAECKVKSIKTTNSNVRYSRQFEIKFRHSYAPYPSIIGIDNATRTGKANSARQIIDIAQRRRATALSWDRIPHITFYQPWGLDGPTAPLTSHLLPRTRISRAFCTCILSYSLSYTTQ